MTSVLISIRPEYCALIAKGVKTVEIRKTLPKIKPPFKCYIYCTKGDKRRALVSANNSAFEYLVFDWRTAFVAGGSICNGKVIGEFVCDKILNVTDVTRDYILDNSCLTVKELKAYARGKQLYGWHISGLLIYDHPLYLHYFYSQCIKQDCEKCGQLQYDASRFAWWCDEQKIIKRPPQSWCYVDGAKYGGV